MCGMGFQDECCPALGVCGVKVGCARFKDAVWSMGKCSCEGASDSKDFLLYFHGCGSQWNVDTSCAVHLQAAFCLPESFLSNYLEQRVEGLLMSDEIIRLRSQFSILTVTVTVLQYFEVNFAQDSLHHRHVSV